jgi:hypothetical protein
VLRSELEAALGRVAAGKGDPPRRNGPRGKAGSKSGGNSKGRGKG